jgi:cation transport regulator ChaC
MAVQTLAEAAAIIAKAAGVLGTNIGYLEQLVAQLQALGIEDDYILRLLAQVHADERT